MIVRITFLIATILYFSSCMLGVSNSCNFIRSYSISKGLYIEECKTLNMGVWGEVFDCYLTDSINFRQKIGTHDEHENFDAKLNADKIEVYNLQPILTNDTIETRTITKADLWKYHNTSTNCLKTLPIFGKNTIQCDDNFYPTSSTTNDDGNFMTEIQYKCGANDLNAVFYTDSLNFCVFLGIHIPGKFECNYKVKKNNNDSFTFYNIIDKWKVASVKTKTFLLTDLKKGKLNKVCK
jgi:hypothetical protein